MGNELFGRVVDLSGLSSIFAEKTLARAFVKLGLDPVTLTALELRRALPELERVLVTFLDRVEADHRMNALQRLAT